jgi:5-methylcytosine-specific restriction endonuclease McrA
MNRLIAELANHEFFISRVSFDDKRYAYRDAVAGFLLAEYVAVQGGTVPTDLSKRFLDELVADNREMTDEKIERLRAAVTKVFKNLCKVFTADDPLLAKTSWLTHYYMTVREVYASYTAEQLQSRLHASFLKFEQSLAENRRRQPENRDPELVEFSKRIQNATKTLSGLRFRTDALLANFLEENPDVVLKDPDRNFTESERHALWVLAGRKCMKCDRNLATLDLVHADHVLPHSRGGLTTLDNGQCLCVECNLAKSAS